MSKRYLIIGAQKAGTSWLYEKLRDIASPELFVPEIKELNFFNSYYESQDSFAHRSNQMADWLRFRLNNEFDPKLCYDLYNFYCSKYIDLNWYNKIFDSQKPISVDICPEYSLLSPDSIYKINQDIHIDGVFLIIRRPSDRAASHIRMDCSKFAAAFNDLLLSDDVYIRSDYQNIISKWKFIFKDRFHILKYDDLIKNPQQFLINFLFLIGYKNEILNIDFFDRIHDSNSYVPLNDFEISLIKERYSNLDNKYLNLLNKY